MSEATKNNQMNILNTWSLSFAHYNLVGDLNVVFAVDLLFCSLKTDKRVANQHLSQFIASSDEKHFYSIW